MSGNSSDTESSCGWTLISNEGSDIETLGLDNALEYGTDLADITPEHQDPHTSVSTAGCLEVNSDAIDDTPKEETFEDTLSASEDLGGAAEKVHVALCSSSDLSSSDIVTLGDMVEVEPAANEESYLGTSSSSQYTFNAVETVLPAQPPPATNCSSSDDEMPGSAATVLRRRRLRRNTSSLLTDPEEEEALESGRREEEEDEERVGEAVVEEKLAGAHLGVTPPTRGHASGGLNTCILLALVMAISMGCGHFYGTIQIQEMKRIVVKNPASELVDSRDVPQQRLKDVLRNEEMFESMNEDFDQGDFVEFLPGMIEDIANENQELKTRQALIQAQSNDLEMRLKQATEELNDMEFQQHEVTTENQLLKNSLERKEMYLLVLQEELSDLNSKVGHLEDRGSGVDSLLLENQRLKDQLEEKKKLVRGSLSQREALMAETRTLRKELDRERRFTEQLRKEMDRLTSSSPQAEDSHAKEGGLQTRLVELEKRLSFEQQRSDLWERLYVETKEDKTKGDPQPEVKKAKDSMAGKVAETFDAVKNTTKEFVHHHKEQIKKAKEAVKENLRKFSDSVKSTFCHFKDCASNFINRAAGGSSKGSNERDTKGSWQHRAHKPQHSDPHKSTGGSFHSSQNTRKSGDKVEKDGDTHKHRASPKGCSGVFDCAFKEFTSVFNKAMEPISADEFNRLLQSYLQQVGHFHHWNELEKFINKFFRNGVFIHDQMLFKDFVTGVEDYMHKYYGVDDGVFEDLDEYVYRHFFGDAYVKGYGPSRTDKPTKERPQTKQQQQQRKQQRSRLQPQRERKWSRSERNSDRHMADVKIELGPMPFDPKY